MKKKKNTIDMYYSEECREEGRGKMYTYLENISTANNWNKKKSFSKGIIRERLLKLKRRAKYPNN